MAQLHFLEHYQNLFDDVKESLAYYISNLKNEMFEIEEGEDNEINYRRIENLFDQYEHNIKNIDEILQQEKEMKSFFKKCKQNKIKMKEEMNHLINIILRLKKNDPNVSQLQYLNYRSFWNKKRNETPEERNRRECEEILEEIKEEKKNVEDMTQKMIDEKKELNEKENFLFNLHEETKNMIEELVTVKEEVEYSIKTGSIENKIEELQKEHEKNLNEIEKVISDNNDKTTKEITEKMNKIENLADCLMEMKDKLNESVSKCITNDKFKAEYASQFVKQKDYDKYMVKFNGLMTKKEADKIFKSNFDEIKLSLNNQVYQIQSKVDRIEYQSNQDKIMYVTKNQYQNDEMKIENKFENKLNEMKEEMNNKVSKNEVNGMINISMRDCVKENELNELKREVDTMKEQSRNNTRNQYSSYNSNNNQNNIYYALNYSNLRPGSSLNYGM